MACVCEGQKPPMLCSPHVMNRVHGKVEGRAMREIPGSDLLATTPAIVAQEREAIARVVERLAELDEARSFVEAGYASLFDYCRRKLLYSDGAANRRIRAARCLTKDPSKSATATTGTVSSSAKRSRFIPREVRRDVQVRDDERCQFVAPDGTRCGARCYLHIDHVTPFALGGTATAENTRLLCSAHNHLLAVQVFGREKVPSRKGV